MLEQVSPSIWMWSEIHGEARGEAYPWNSYLIRIPDEEEIVLVDPLPMSSEELSYVEQTGIPTYIVLTCEYHLRHAEEWRKRWGMQDSGERGGGFEVSDPSRWYFSRRPNPVELH